MGKGLKTHILTPNQVMDVVLPLYLTLELLPQGLFLTEHANRLIHAMNLLTVDKDRTVLPTVRDAAEAVAAMRARVSAGKRWGCTAQERQVLAGFVRVFDARIRKWDKVRYEVAERTVEELTR